MRSDKLTSKFQLALADAQSLAVGREHQFVEPIHLMAALLEQDGSAVRGLLTKAGVNIDQLRSQLGEALDRQPSVSGGAPGELHISNDLSNLLNVADKLAQDLGDAYISSELFVLAAIDDRGDLGRILKAAGAIKGALERAIEEVRELRERAPQVMADALRDAREAFENGDQAAAIANFERVLVTDLTTRVCGFTVVDEGQIQGPSNWLVAGGWLA